MTILLILPFLFSGFMEKWYIPDGKNAYGRLLVGAIDHDELTDIVVRRDQPIKVMFYELDILNQWQLQDSIVGGGDHLLWALGDFDLDGFSDIVFQKTFGIPNVGIAIYESPDSFSYPTQEIWRDTIGQAAVTPISVHDIDLDGLPEIVKVGADGIDFVIYETIGDNLYARIYEDTIQGINTPLSTIAFGDFDNDNKIEFVLGNLSDGIGAAYWLYESPSDNTYEFIHSGSIPTKNIKDCFSVSDADGDGKLEFLVKGFVVPTARIHAFIFETVGDNTYEIIKTFDLFGGSNDYYGGYSEAGDVDGDSIPEIVLEGCQNIYIIKSASNDSFYVWDTLPGHVSGSNVRVYDIDGNGLSEIIISGNSETRIYEYEEGGIEEIRVETQVTKLDIFPNPFIDKTHIRCTIHGHPASQGEAGDTGCRITDDRLSVKVYDVAGCLVRNIGLPTTYSLVPTVITWDGKDDNGRQVPSGVYFVRLETPERTETCKIVKLK